MSTKHLYIAGPMTGLPQFNVPAFERMAARLRASGHEVVSPAELDSPAVREAALKSSDGKLDENGKLAGETWGDMLARDVKIIADVIRDGIVVLPGWQASRGARLEVFVGLLCGKTIYVDAHYGESGSGDPLGMSVHLTPLNVVDVIFAITRSFIK